MTSPEQIATSVASHMLMRSQEQLAVLLSACKTAYADQMHPGSVVSMALLDAIRSVEPDFPERVRR